MARLQLPIPKITNGVVNGPTAANTTCSFDVIQNKCLTGVDVTATVVTVANPGVKAIPTLAMALGEARFIIGSSNQRRRTMAQLFGQLAQIAVTATGPAFGDEEIVAKIDDRGGGGIQRGVFVRAHNILAAA